METIIKYMKSTTETQILTPEEFKEFKDTHIEYQTLLVNLGLITLDLESLKQEKSKLLNLFDTFKIKREEISKNLFKKYGNIEIDMETGKIIPVL